MTKTKARIKWENEQLAEVLRESNARDAEATGQALRTAERAPVEDAKWHSHFLHSFHLPFRWNLG